MGGLTIDSADLEQSAEVDEAKRIQAQVRTSVRELHQEHGRHDDNDARERSWGLGDDNDRSTRPITRNVCVTG